jgi:uncharacterized protein YkwD
MLRLGFLMLVLVSPLAWGQEFPQALLKTFRDEAGLSLPQWDEVLAATCRDRAAALAEAGVLTHEDARGRGPGGQLVAQGLGEGLYGEILGAGSDAAAVWKAWLASPRHRAVLADPRWKTWGWGTARTAASVVWVVRFRAP